MSSRESRHAGCAPLVRGLAVRQAHRERFEWAADQSRCSELHGLPRRPYQGEGGIKLLRFANPAKLARTLAFVLIWLVAMPLVSSTPAPIQAQQRTPFHLQEATIDG